MTEILRDPLEAFIWFQPQVGTPTIVPGGRTGNALQVSASNNSAQFTIPIGLRSEYGIFGVAFKAAALTSNSQEIFAWLADSTTPGNYTHDVVLRVQTNGSLNFIRGGTSISLGASAAGVITANTWAYVEVSLRIHDTDGYLIARVNGVEVINVTGVDTKGSSGSYVTGLARLYLLNGLATATHQFDDFYCKVGAGETFNGDITVPVSAASLDRVMRDSVRTGRVNPTPAAPLAPPTHRFIRHTVRVARPYEVLNPAYTVKEDGFEDPALPGWTVPFEGYMQQCTGRTGYGIRAISSLGSALLTIPHYYESDWVTIGTAWRTDNLGGVNSVIVLRSDAGATTHLTVCNSATGALEVRRGNASGTLLVTTVAGVITPNTWAYVELQARLSDGSGSVLLRVDGVVVGSNLTADTKNGGSKLVFDSVFIGGVSNDCSWDDLYVVSGPGGTFRGDRTYDGTGPFEVSEESFESNFGAWTIDGGTPTIVPGRTGNGVELTSSVDRLALAIPVAQQSPFVVLGFAMRVDNAPTGPTDFINFYRTGGGVMGGLRLGIDGRMSWSGVAAITPPGAFTFGVWNYVEFSILANGVGSSFGGELAIRVNGVQVGYQRDVNITSGEDIISARFTGIAGSAGVTLVDDLYALTGTRSEFRGDVPPDTPTSAMIRVWDGAEFLDAAGVNIWTGSEFEETSLLVWDGSAWEAAP